MAELARPLSRAFVAPNRLCMFGKLFIWGTLAFEKVFALQVVVDKSVVLPLRGEQSWNRYAVAHLVGCGGEFVCCHNDCRNVGW